MKFPLYDPPVQPKQPQFQFSKQRLSEASLLGCETTLPRGLGRLSRKWQMGQGKWKVREREAYLRFVFDNPELFENEKRRRSTKVFILMAQKIGSRSAEQCRSHHQKMMLYNQSIEGVLTNLPDIRKEAARRRNSSKDPSSQSKRSPPVERPLQVQIKILDGQVRISIDVSCMQGF